MAMSHAREMPVAAPRAPVTYDTYSAADDLVYKRRYRSIKSLVYLLEDENNLIALKIAQVQARLDAAKAREAAEAAAAADRARAQEKQRAHLDHLGSLDHLDASGGASAAASAAASEHSVPRGEGRRSELVVEEVKDVKPVVSKAKRKSRAKPKKDKNASQPSSPPVDDLIAQEMDIDGPAAGTGRKDAHDDEEDELMDDY